MTDTGLNPSQTDSANSMMNRRLTDTYGDPLVNAHCREFEVNKWALSEFVVHRLLPIVGIHPYPLDELLLMSAAVCRLRPRHIFEWGTNVGKSARIFATSYIVLNRNLKPEQR